MKVLIVDDSIVYRKGISLALESEDEIEVVGVANNGKLGVEKVKELSPDLLILDLEMPIMDGLSALKEIRKFNSNCFILVFSSLSESGAKITMEALSSGANDFLTKSSQSGGTIESSIEQLKKDLVPKILQFKNKRKLTNEKNTHVSAQTTLGALKVFNAPKVIGIGSSTGGPDTLKSIFKNLSTDNHIPILIAQHMPPFFTKQFAEMLNKISHFTVKEAVDGEKILQKHCYIAPGDFHMLVRSEGDEHYIKIVQTEKVHFVRPAVDKLFESIADVYKRDCMAFLLTGMGADGALGMKRLKEYGVPLVIQDEASSTVWGMPAAVFELGIQDAICDPQQIANHINDVNKKFFTIKKI